MQRRAVAAYRGMRVLVVLALAGGGCGGPTAPAPGQGVTVRPSSTAVVVGDKVAFTATIPLNRSVSPGEIRWIVAREANQRWSAGPVGELTAAPDARSVEWIAPAVGQYDIRVGVAGTWGAASPVTVSWLPWDSPLLGTWSLKTWQLAPQAGGPPEEVAFQWGQLSVDSDGLSLSAVGPGQYLYDDPTQVLSYAGGAVEGQQLQLCPAPGATSCLGATWALTDSVLTIVGPETAYLLPDGRIVVGVSTFEFVR